MLSLQQLLAGHQIMKTDAYHLSVSSAFTHFLFLGSCPLLFPLSYIGFLIAAGPFLPCVFLILVYLLKYRCAALLPPNHTETEPLLRFHSI